VRLIGSLKYFGETGSIKPQKGWILSPLYDVIFIFGGSIAALLILTLKEMGNSASTDLSILTLFVVSFALNGGHMVAGLSLLIFNREERARAKRVEPRIYKQCLAIILVCLALFGGSAILFSQASDSDAFRFPIRIAGFLYFLWNGWHFGMQQFGLLQIYRKKHGITTNIDRHFDRVQCLLFVSIIPSLLLFSIGRRDDFFESYFGNLEVLNSHRTEIFFVAIVMACLAIARVSYKKHWRWPIALCYAGIFLIPFAMSFNPVLFIFLAAFGPHYLQEIFLITVIGSSEDSDGQRLVKKSVMFFGFVVLIAASIGFYIALELAKSAGGHLGIHGSIRLDSGLDMLGFWTVAGIASVFAIFNFFHFYLDRLIFAKRADLL